MKKLIIAALPLVLGACSLVPGAHIPHSASSSDSSWYQAPTDQDDSTDLKGKVDIHRISPALLARLADPAPEWPAFNADLEQAIAEYDYVVGRGDVLNITVWDHPELTIPAGSERSPQEAGNWVHNDGTIFYPYVGKVKVEGLKVTEIRDILRERLAEYLEKPQVDVTIAAFRSKRVYVTGEVKEPGNQPITNVPLTLLEAINRTGGLTELADWTDVTLTRAGRTERFSLRELYQNGNTRQNILLQPNDIVHVARNDAAKVFVLGEVTDPQSITLGRAGLTLAEALSEAGGFREATANASGVFVMRRAEAGSGKIAQVFQLHARDATALVLADQFQLERRDIIYVTAAPLARWNRVVTQLLPTAQALYFVAQAEDEITNSN